MQSYLQWQRIRDHLQYQIVQGRGPESGTVYTRVRPYVYRGGCIQPQPRDHSDDNGWRRRIDMTSNQRAAAESILPRHSLRTHLERDGDIERADFQPDIGHDPYTINTRESLGDEIEMMVTGLETSANSKPIEEEKMVMVTFEGEDDPLDPHNWFFSTRVLATAIVTSLNLVVIWASTIHAPALTTENKAYLGSMEVEGLFSTLYLLGLAFGGMFTGPISEVFGRNPVYIAILSLFMLFTITIR
ncbi:Major Facilitator Superfamily [Aspergillus sclerotialis]|uniref:Major Facilitator Superfamily n=1 Tax=Aspergillus sclerotialis TaxID=2070753 RepID=A0A3A2ZLC7_9EURO|nr:Major Facilitator Superfamily [Aspergillus sclerotialis]